LLIALTSCASAKPTVTSITTDTAQPIAREPFSITVTAQNLFTDDSFSMSIGSNTYSGGSSRLRTPRTQK